MKDIEKIGIRSPRHKGWVVLVYIDGLLAMHSSLNITGNYRKWYLDHLPIGLAGIKAFAEKWKEKKIEVSLLDVPFDDFWEAYGHKINAKRCVPIWKKMTRKQRLLAYYRIWHYDEYLKDTGIAKLNPENYLRDERYNDEAW